MSTATAEVTTTTGLDNNHSDTSLADAAKAAFATVDAPRMTAYVILAADPAPEPALYERGTVDAAGADAAKRIALDKFPDLRDRANADGVLLRAVPARSWPDTEPTRYEPSDPKLVLG